MNSVQQFFYCGLITSVSKRCACSGGARRRFSALLTASLFMAIGIGPVRGQEVFREDWQMQQFGTPLDQLQGWQLSDRTTTTPLGGIFGEGGNLELVMDAPQFETIGIQTNVSVPDGGTVLLGGVRRLSQDTRRLGVPLISGIPYVSRLFKNVGIGQQTQSLMMMVTPRIIIQEEISAGGAGAGANESMGAEITIGYESGDMLDVAAHGLVSIDPFQRHKYTLGYEPVGTHLKLLVDDALVLAGETMMTFDFSVPVFIGLEVSGGAVAVDNIVLEVVPEPMGITLALLGMLSIVGTTCRQRNRPTRASAFSCVSVAVRPATARLGRGLDQPFFTI